MPSAYPIRGPFFIGPMNFYQDRNAKYLGERRVRYNLWRFYINGESDF